MPVETTAIERKHRDYENVATPFDWPENKTPIDIYLDSAATSQDLAAFISSDHIYTDKYGTRYFGDIAVPSLLTQFSNVANDIAAPETSEYIERLILNAGQTSLYDRIMNLITRDGQPDKAVNLIDNAVQHMTDGNKEKTLSAIVDFWNAMTANGFNDQADYLSGTLAIWGVSPEDEGDKNNRKLLIPKPENDFQPIVIGGRIAHTPEEAEFLRRFFANQTDASRNGPA